MKHINQNCGSSCGPTSLKMIMMSVGYMNNMGIQDIFSMAPTKIGGTPWSRMCQIIRKLNIKHKVLYKTPISYFKKQTENKVWMLSVYYGDIKHWVVLKIENHRLIVLDPADTIKIYTDKSLGDIFYTRGGLAIEFDMNDFNGESINYETHDDDGDYIMNYVDKMKMRLLEDSNFIFGLKGKKVKKLSDFNGDIKADYIYGIFDYGDLASNENIFAYNENSVILLKFKNSY